MSPQRPRPLMGIHRANALLGVLMNRIDIPAAPGEVPRVFHQYWDREPPPDVVGLLDWNRSVCERAGIEFRLFDDAQARDFISDFARDTVRAYDIAPHPSMKCDLFRLCFLERHGGFYLDADMVVRENFEELYALPVELVVFKWDRPDAQNACNWLIGSAPGAEAIRFVRETTEQSILRACTRDPQHAIKHMLGTSGPGLFTQAVATWVESKPQGDQASLPIAVCPVDYAFMHVQNGAGFLRRELDYKGTDRYWRNVADRI